MARTQPRRDTEYISWAENLHGQCVAGSAAWGLDEKVMQKFTTLYNKAREAYDRNLNKATKNYATSSAKSLSFQALRDFMRFFIPMLLGNMEIPNVDIITMGLPSRDRHAREPNPPSTRAPALNVLPGKHRWLDVYASVPSRGHPGKYAREKGERGIVLRYKVEGDNHWQESYHSRLHVSLLFEKEQVGKNLTIAGAWVNTCFKRGPWSDEITVLIN
jgi:hypothetical protein